MIRKIALALMAAAGVFAFASSAMAQNETSFSYEADRSGAAVRFRTTTTLTADNLWLLVTIYPPKEIAGETLYKTYAVKKGRNAHEILLDARYKNGTFEAAVYRNKLLKGRDCPPTDQLCQSVGYRLSDMALYVWGYIDAR